MAWRAVIGEPVDVMDVRADAAVAELVEPAVVAFEAEAVEHLGVANIKPETGDVRRVFVEEFAHLAGARKLVVVVAVLEADGDAVSGGVRGDLGERPAGVREKRRDGLGAALNGAACGATSISAPSRSLAS